MEHNQSNKSIENNNNQVITKIDTINEIPVENKLKSNKSEVVLEEMEELEND